MVLTKITHFPRADALEKCRPRIHLASRRSVNASIVSGQRAHASLERALCKGLNKIKGSFGWVNEFRKMVTLFNWAKKSKPDAEVIEEIDQVPCDTDDISHNIEGLSNSRIL